MRFAASYTAAWCSGDPARVADHFAPTGSLKINDAEPAVGRAAIEAAAAGFMATFPDLHLDMDGLEEAADSVVYHWTLTGTNASNGCPVKISGREEWTIGEDGLIGRSLGHFDAADYDRQLAGQ